MRSIIHIIGISTCVFLFAACGASPSKSSSPQEDKVVGAGPNDASHLPPAVAKTYEAHTQHIPAGKHLAYDLTLTFRGTERFRGPVQHDASTSRISMMRAADSVALHFDGEQVAIVPDTATWKGARFAAFTWPYFAAAPYKLADPGTRWAAPKAFGWRDGEQRIGAKLTFAPGTGDAPDDYYIAFTNDQGLLDGLAYIVTFGKGPDGQASAEPHAILYSDYRVVDGVPVAHRWDFTMWDAKTGIGESLGFADLSRIRWVQPTPEDYATSGGKVVEAPE